MQSDFCLVWLSLIIHKCRNILYLHLERETGHTERWTCTKPTVDQRDKADGYRYLEGNQGCPDPLKFYVHIYFEPNVKLNYFVEIDL